MKVEKNKGLELILVGIVLFTIIYQSKENYFNRLENGVRTTAELYVGYNVTWTYEVNGKKYEGKRSQTSFSPTLYTGERYYVYYDSKYAMSSSFVPSEPIIDSLDFYKLTSLPMSIDLEKGYQNISFKYEVDGNIIENLNVKKLSKNVKIVDEKFDVYVNKKNVNNSYIIFPSSDSISFK
ncbi:hypothetical protein [Aureivirga sp. CE67]|uniref:hypothetical protein n=1 Tax=Aureivirga sp. CE67 TaxID=1788983 RepID=UPI0018C8FFA9|nr:hypothetical protein [Aureivirga sp. CE67]